MTSWLALAFAVLAALAVACSFQGALGLPRGQRLAVLGVFEVFVLLTPLLVDPEPRFARFLAGVLAVALAAKLFDLHLGASLGDRPSFWDVFTYLINLASIVRRKLGDEPRPGFRADLRRLAQATLASLPGGFLFAACYRVERSCRSTDGDDAEGGNPPATIGRGATSRRRPIIRSCRGPSANQTIRAIAR